jgi:hypothetical protein
MKHSEHFEISFGRITYGRGAPKNLPRWFWVCDCSKCEQIPVPAKLHGPFKTRREAERDLEEVLVLINADGGTPN